MFNKLYENVCLFNNLAGNKQGHASFVAQMKCLNEEVKETEVAIAEKDIVGILDGAIDTIYVAMGILQKLENLGVDIKGAIKQVRADNLTKFPIDELDAQKTVLHYNSQNINVSYSYNAEYNRYAIKDSNGKLRKPHNFIPTDLSGYVPEGVKL